MAFEVRNQATAADPQYVNVLGLRAYARARTLTTAEAEPSDTTLLVSDASKFRVGDTITIDGDDQIIASIDYETHELTIDALSSGHASGSVVFAPWHDFGHVRNPDREQDLTELDIKSARLGRLATIKKLTTELTLEFTFDSISVFDRETIAFHTGGAAGAGVIGTGATYAAEDFDGSTVQFLMVQENAETSGRTKIAFYPNAIIKGDGEESGDGENEASLTFRVTVLQDEDYSISSALAADEPDAPYGFRYIVPRADLEDVLDEL